MKMRHTTAKKRIAARSTQRDSSNLEGVNLPRLFLFLEVFVDKEIPGRSAK